MGLTWRGLVNAVERNPVRRDSPIFLDDGNYSIHSVLYNPEKMHIILATKPETVGNVPEGYIPLWTQGYVEKNGR